MLLGKVALVKLVQPLNVFVPRLLKPSGSVTLVKLVQFWNV